VETALADSAIGFRVPRLNSVVTTEFSCIPVRWSPKHQKFQVLYYNCLKFHVRINNRTYLQSASSHCREVQESAFVIGCFPTSTSGSVCGHSSTAPSEFGRGKSRRQRDRACQPTIEVVKQGRYVVVCTVVVFLLCCLPTSKSVVLSCLALHCFSGSRVAASFFCSSVLVGLLAVLGEGQPSRIFRRNGARTRA